MTKNNFNLFKNNNVLTNRNQQGLLFLMVLLLVSGITITIIVTAMLVGINKQGNISILRRQEINQQGQLNLANASNLLKDFTAQTLISTHANYAANTILVDTFSAGNPKLVCNAFKATPNSQNNYFACQGLTTAFTYNNLPDFLNSRMPAASNTNNTLSYKLSSKDKVNFNINLTPKVIATQISPTENQVRSTIKLEASAVQAVDNAFNISLSKVVTATRSCPAANKPVTLKSGQVFNPDLKLLPIPQTTIDSLVQDNARKIWPFLYCTCNGATTLEDGSCLACDTNNNFVLNDNKDGCRCKDGYYIDQKNKCQPCPDLGLCENGIFVGCLNGFDKVENKIYRAYSSYYSGYICICPTTKFINKSNVCTTCHTLSDAKKAMDKIIMEEDDTIMGIIKKKKYIDQKASEFLETNYPNIFPLIYNEELFPEVTVATCNGTKDFLCKDGFYKIDDECRICPAQGTCKNNTASCDRTAPIAYDNYYFFDGWYKGEIHAGCYACPRRNKVATTWLSRCDCRNPKYGTRQDDQENTVWPNQRNLENSPNLHPDKIKAFNICHPYDQYYDPICGDNFELSEAYGRSCLNTWY